MFLSCPNASAVQSISHEGKVVLVATVTSDGVSSLRYSVKQDGFEQTALQNPLGSGWESFKPLPLPTDSIGDASVEQWEARELSDSDGRPLLRSLYRSAQLTADAPVQLISHDGAIHVFRQSRRGTLLVDRFVLDGMTNTLNPKYEVRYKRSRQRLAPSKSMKQRPDGQLESLDGLDFRDMQNQFFTEPSIEICAPLAEGIRDGNFAVVVVPTNEPDHYRWHIFHANAGDSQVQCLSLRSGEDQVFSLYDYTKTSLDPLTNTTTYTLLHGVIQRSIALVSTRGQNLRVTNGLAAVLYDVQREQQTAAGPQLLLDATKLMLAVPTDAGVMALNFALAADGTLARISADSTETILRSKQREVLLPLSVMDEIRAVGDATPAPGGTIQAISRSTGDSNADRVRVSVADGEQAELERLHKGDVVRLFNTTTYNGLYAVRSVENGAFCIDAPFRYDDVGEWEKVEEEDNGLVFDGLITAYEKTGDGVVKVEAVNHGLLAGDLVQIVESPDVGGEYQILERDAQGFTVQRLWGSAEAVNVKIAMRKRRGLVFDGKSDGIRAELATTVHLAKGFTLETWVKLSRSGNQTLVATVPESPAPGVAQRCWQALLGIKAGKLNVTFRPINLGATEAVSLSGKQKAPLQEWLHVACSFDGEQLRLMQNGEEVASLAGSALEQAAAAGHAALLEALTADANQAAADLSASGLPADHPSNYLAGRWVCRSSEQLLTPEDGGTAALGWPSEQLQQSWTLDRQAPDRFSLRHSGSGQVLNHGGRLVRWQNKPDQLWSLRGAGGGWYQLCTPEGNQVLAADGSQVRLVAAESSAGDTSEQLWRFDPIGATKVNIAQTALAAARLLAPRPGQGIPVAVAALTMAGHEEAGSWKAPFQGQLSDLRFWDSGRPAQQVSHAMHLQMLGRERGLLGSWRLGGVASDDDGVQRAFDFSVNANHGLVRGAPYDGGILLGRTLRDQTTAAVMFSNGDLVAVSEGAIYVESFEFRTDPSLDPRNADGKQGAIFAPSLWGRSSRGAEEKQAITATQEGFQFEELGEGWWRASSRFVIPQGVRLLRCFELAQVRGSWSTLELRRHGLNLVSDTVTLSLADEQAQLSLASGEAALGLGEEDIGAQLAKAEQSAKAALEMAALSQSQLEKEKADPRHFTRINLVQDSAQQWPVAAASYKAIALNGKEDCVTLPPAAMPTGAEITISFWLRCTGSSPVEHYVILGTDANVNRTVCLHIPWTNGKVYFDCGGVGSGFDRLSKEVAWDSLRNFWTHWAFSKNARTGLMRIYRNGEVWAESSGNTLTMSETTNLCVGAEKPDKGFFFPGSIDQLQIWSRECSQAEIQAGMRQPLKGTEPGLCGYWRGWEGQFFDFSPHKRHGRLEGAPTWTASVLESTPLALVTDTLPAFSTSPEGQWEQRLQTDASGEVSGQLLWRGAKANPRFLGRLASTDGERPTLLDDSDPERIRWILEPGEKAGAYALRAPGQTLTYLGWNTSYRFKTPARFLRFDGKQDYADVPFKAGVHDLKAFTVAFWVRFAKGQFGSPLTCRSAPAAGLSGFMFYVDDRDQIQFILGRSTEWVAVISPKVTSDSWIHVCGSYDGKAIRLYINGEPVGSKDCTDYRPNAAAASRPLRLGAGKTEASADYAYKGDLAEVSIWNQPLSSEKIKAFMTRSLSSIESDLVAYYPLSALDTIAGKKRCLLDRAGKNPGRVVGGTPQLITIDEQTSGFRLDYAPDNRGYSFKTPARFVRFDGKKDYADVPFKAGVHDLKVFTVAFWVRFSQGQFGSPLTCRSAPAAGLSGFMFYVDEKDQVQFILGRADWLALTSPKLSPDTWIHVCGSHDGQTTRLYINGELITKTSCTDYKPNTSETSNPLRFGGGKTEAEPDYMFKGDIAEVSLWNHPLKSPQIKAFMNRSLSGREPNLVAYYPLSALDTIAGKERCLLDRAGQNPGQVRSGAPQLIAADRLTSGFRMDPEFLPLCLDAFPMRFQLKPVAGTETAAGAEQIQAAAAKYAAAEEQAKQTAEQLAELRAMFDLLAELGITSPAGKTTFSPPLAALLPPLAAAESREAELVSRMKWLKIAIGQLSDIDKLRLDLSSQVIVTDQHLRDLERAKNWLRVERNDITNYWGVLLIGVESGRYMVTHQDSWRPTWGKKACLGIDSEGATIELDHSNFARGWWQVMNLVNNTWTTLYSRDRSGGFALFNPSPASNGGQLLCSVPWPRELILAGTGEARSSVNRLFMVNNFGSVKGELCEIQALNGGYIGASNHAWNGSLVWTDTGGCRFRMIGSPGAENAEGASRIQNIRSLVQAGAQKYNDSRSRLEELTIMLDSQSKLLLAYQHELADVTEQLAGQLKRIQVLRSLYLTRLRASQSEAQVLPTLPDQEDPRGLIVQGGAIPFPRAASRLTASAGCNGIVSFLYHDPRANLVRARYDMAYDADGRGEEWIPDGFHAALALEGTRSILGLPAALFRPLNQQITLEFWARCDSSHPNEVVFLVGLDRQNRPVLRIQLPNAKEEVVWEAGANPSDGALDRLSCSVPASLYREAWTHWAFVKDAERGEMHIYANGQLLASHIPEAGGAKPLQQPLGGICRAALGGAPGASQAWQGQISELRLWNRALSPRTIESNSVLTLAGNEPGLLAYYPLNEASGEFARDHSGQGFSMRITGASWVPCTAPMGRLPEQQPTALIRDMAPLAGKQPLALPPVGLKGGGFSLGMRLRVEAFLPTTTLVELSTEDQSDVLSMGYLPAKQLWTLQQRVKGVVHSLEFKLELKTHDWVHLAFTISAKGEVLAYRNGVAVGSGLLPLPGPGLRTANVAGGANAGAASAYPARIEHLRVWDKALSRWEIARQALHAPGFGHAVLAEYSRVVIDAQKRKNAMMMRCLAIANGEGIALLDEQWIENLEMKWVGNTQINPTLIGYIEGAPPIPSENLTEEDDYNGATSVELVQSSDVAYSWTREQDVSLGAEIEVLLGAKSETSAGVGVITSVEEVKSGLGGKFDFAYHWQNSSTVEASSSLSQSDRLELRGCQEESPRFPHLGRRFIPKNVGYALVTSGLADVFVSRLSRSGRMVGYQVLPVEGMPPDVNTITFLMNPAYTMAGSLDGLTGSAPTSQRFHRHVPGMRAQYGSLYPASYYRLQEAYNLKAEIDKRDTQRQAYFNQFNAGMVDETSLNRHISSAGDEPDAVGSPGGSIAVGADDTSPEMKELDAKIAAKKAQIELAENSGKPEDAQRVPLLKAEEQALQKQRSDLSAKEQESRRKKGAARQQEIDAKHKDLSARAHATDSFASWQRTMENLQIRAAKRNIVNTYVWDGDGGFHAEEQQFASTVEHSIGGSFDMGFAMGGKLGVALTKVLVELSAYVKLNLTQTMNKTQTTSTGMELHVDLGGVESRRITDHRDYPLFPGEKVDRYRFMSFYLENNASHWHDFFNTVVDPEWLSSNDEEARALRQTRQALPNKVWRVLHRVTYVERPTLMGFGRQQAPVNELSDAMQELQVQVQELTTKVDKVQRTLDSQ